MHARFFPLVPTAAFAALAACAFAAFATNARHIATPLDAIVSVTVDEAHVNRLL